MVNDKDVLADSKNNSVEVKPLDQKPTVPLTPDLKAYDDSETDDWFAAGTPLWKRWLRYAGTGIVVLLVVVLLGRTVHHVINSNKKSNTVATKTTQVTSGASTTSSAGRSAATTSTPTATSTPADSTIPNTGPGNDLAVFAVAVAAATALHYAVNLRRTNR